MIKMQAKARKLKIRVRKGKWFVLTLPALSFKFLKRILHISLRFAPKDMMMPEREYMANGNPNSKDKWEKQSHEEMDFKELLKDLDLLFDELALLEPFILVEVSDETENVYVKIETI